MLHELDRERVNYIIVGAFARVIQGSDELTRGIDITPSARPENLERLEPALENLNATAPDGKPLDLTELDLAEEPVSRSRATPGEMKIVLEPVGTRGYDDLRRRANREPIGQGLRPSVAGPATSSACSKPSAATTTASASR